MLDNLKMLIRNKKKKFNDLCLANNLNLDFHLNKNEFNTLNSIFESREYADYFPFYQKVNVIDIGGHYGYFSIFAGNNTDKESKIITVEPSSVNFKVLKKNIGDCNISNVKSYHCAIGGRSGNLKLFLGQAANHSIVKNYRLLKKDPVFEEVEVKTLEELITENDLSNIDFLKLDCEGAEYAILEQTPDYIYKRINTISMEFHDLKDVNATGEKLVKLLIKNGFEIVKYQYDKTTMNLNYGKIIGTKLFVK